jgi:hypothetical protein
MTDIAYPLFKLYDRRNDKTSTTKVDYTSNILVPSYQVIEYDLSESWTDGFGKTHRSVYRSKIAGKFTMQFRSYDEYHEFMNILESNRNSEEDYYLVASVYKINKRDVGEDVEMMISMAPKLNPKELGGIEDLEVSMEER